MTLSRFKTIFVFYNPKSTGHSKQMAKVFKSELRSHRKNIEIKLIPTRYEGHATELARKYGEFEDSLLISSSGDGGYNELINGVKKLPLKFVHPVCAVLPAGNANDHFHAINKKPIIENIIQEKVRRIDLLRAEFTDSEGRKQTKYAHSYIGIGITPVVGHRLNQKKLNSVNEKAIAITTVFKFNSTRIKYRGKISRIDSLVFSNIGRMAKIFVISEKSKVNDGLFEMRYIDHRTILHRVRHILEMVVRPSSPDVKQVSSYTFEVCEKTPIQFDGEVIHVAPHTKVRVSIDPKALKTVV